MQLEEIRPSNAKANILTELFPYTELNYKNKK